MPHSRPFHSLPHPAHRRYRGAVIGRIFMDLRRAIATPGEPKAYVESLIFWGASNTAHECFYQSLVDEGDVEFKARADVRAILSSLKTGIP